MAVLDRIVLLSKTVEYSKGCGIFYLYFLLLGVTMAHILEMRQFFLGFTD